MSDVHMRDDQDALLTRLFAEQAESLPTADFMPQLAARIELEYRKRRTRSIIAFIVALVLAIALVPWLAQTTAVLVDLSATATNAIGSVLASPIAWLVAGALVLAFAPVFYVWRTFRA